MFQKARSKAVLFLLIKKTEAGKILYAIPIHRQM